MLDAVICVLIKSNSNEDLKQELIQKIMDHDDDT